MVAMVAEVKKALAKAGLELYRTRGREVCIAERVRENLLMDSGVSVVCDDGAFAVRLIVRAQRSDFPTDSASALFQRARSLAAEAARRGFRESTAAATPMQDPVDASRTLDVWYEVAFCKAVATIGDAMAEVRFALGLDKTVRTEVPAIR